MDFICFGGEDWWYHNRGHIDMQLMRRFAKLGTTLYINSIVMQRPSLRKGGMFFKRLTRKIKSIFAGLKMSDAGFWVYSPFSMPVHHLRWLRPVNRLLLQLQICLVSKKLGIKKPIVWVACPAACDVARNMKKQKLVYQRTDRFEDYPNIDKKTIIEYDHALKAEADLTIFVNNTLYNEEENQCKKAIYLDHGVDFDMFASAENDKSIPDDMKGIAKPVVGFFGDIDEQTTDTEMIDRITELLPRMNFVFLGKASVDCSGILSKKNVWMLGHKPYEQVPHYGKCFDVCIMPWKQNRWIQACNPIKLKEYLALGKPVVSTPFPELQKYLDVVYQAGNRQEFVKCIEKALASDSSEKITARRDKVKTATWDFKAQLVYEILFERTDDDKQEEE